MKISPIVVGFRHGDEKWEEMKSIWISCKKVGIQIPNEVRDFFDDESPEDQPGERVDIDYAVSDITGDDDVVEVDLTKIPKGLTSIWFYKD